MADRLSDRCPAFEFTIGIGELLDDRVKRKAYLPSNGARVNVGALSALVRDRTADSPLLIVVSTTRASALASSTAAKFCRLRSPARE